jgi:hypothetical protein
MKKLLQIQKWINDHGYVTRINRGRLFLMSHAEFPKGEGLKVQAIWIRSWKDAKVNLGY